MREDRYEGEPLFFACPGCGRVFIPMAVDGGRELGDGSPAPILPFERGWECMPCGRRLQAIVKIVEPKDR